MAGGAGSATNVGPSAAVITPPDPKPVTPARQPGPGAGTTPDAKPRNPALPANQDNGLAQTQPVTGPAAVNNKTPPENDGQQNGQGQVGGGPEKFPGHATGTPPGADGGTQGAGVQGGHHGGTGAEGVAGGGAGGGAWHIGGMDGMGTGGGMGATANLSSLWDSDAPYFSSNYTTSPQGGDQRFVPGPGQPNPQPAVQPGYTPQPTLNPQPNPLPPSGTTFNAVAQPASPNPLPQGTTLNTLTTQQVVAPATALAGTSVTIGPGGVATPGRPGNDGQAVVLVRGQTPPGAAQTGAPVPGMAPAPALATTAAAGLINPRAQAAAAAALQGTGVGVGPGTGTLMPTGPNPAAVRPGQPTGALPLASQGQAFALAAAAGRGGVPGSVQALAQAQVALTQAALAQTLGRVTAGQMTAGGAAMALAEAQLALRAGRLAMAQAQAQMGLPAAAQGQRGTPGAPVPLAQPSVAPRTAANAGAAALGTAPGRVGAQALPASAQAPRAGQLEPLANKGGAALRDGGQKQAELGAAAAMPKKLATALAMAPKLRKRGSHDRVEKVDSFTPRMQSPEMEDEDFWDAAGDEDDDWADDAPPQDEGAATSAAEAAAQHYRALQLWLQANDQQALLRELALGQRVLVLAPPDKTQQVVAPATALAGTSVTIGPGGVATPGRPGNGGRGGWGRARLHAKPSRRGPQSWRQGQPVWQPVTSSFLAKLAASPRPICAASY